jgi:hypothetical protein
VETSQEHVACRREMNLQETGMAMEHIEISSGVRNDLTWLWHLLHGEVKHFGSCSCEAVF